MASTSSISGLREQFFEKAAFLFPCVRDSGFQTPADAFQILVVAHKSACGNIQHEQSTYETILVRSQDPGYTSREYKHAKVAAYGDQKSSVLAALESLLAVTAHALAKNNPGSSVMAGIKHAYEGEFEWHADGYVAGSMLAMPT